MSDDDLGLTIAELAAYFACSPRTIRYLVADNRITPTGRRGRAKTYPLQPVVRAELATRQRRLRPLSLRWRSRPAYLEPADDVCPQPDQPA